jgi:hypothetical protein
VCLVADRGMISHERKLQTTIVVVKIETDNCKCDPYQTHSQTRLAKSSVMGVFACNVFHIN